MKTPLAENFTQANASRGPGSGPGMASAGELAAGRPDVPHWLMTVDRVLGWMVALPAGALVLAEIVLLFWGVVARYAFRSPLVWGDELASAMFLWLAMTGAATALHRGAHMRMTAIVNRARKRGSANDASNLAASNAPTTHASGHSAHLSKAAKWDIVALVASMFFLGLIALPAFAYIQQQWAIITPSLEFNDGLRVAAILYAVVIMLLMCITKLAAIGWKAALAGVIATVVLVVILRSAGPVLSGLGNFNLVIFFVGVVGCTVLSGMPIAFSFGLAVFSYLSLSTSMPLEIVVSRMDEGMSQLILLAVPMFIFLGLLIEMTGMARAMINFLASLLGHVRGGLSYVLVGAMYLVSGISGSKAADMAAVAPVLFPEMKQRGESPGQLVALLSATGAQTETVPPSIVLITIGSVTGVSISALFTGGLLPGGVLALALCLLVWWRSRKTTPVSASRATSAVIGKTLLVAIPALALPFVIRFAVVEGVATATEVSTVGIVYAMLAGLLIYRRFDWRRVGPMLIETATLSGAILIIIGTATAMAWALTQSGFSHTLASTMEKLPGGPAAFMAVSVVMFVLLGSVLEGIPAIVLFGPLLFPIARDLGIHEVQYAMVVILSMGLGLFSPPFGVGYYGACAVSKIHPDEGIRPIVGYMIALFIGIVVIAAIPWLSIGFLKKP